MAGFEVTGNLLTDLQNSIDNQNIVYLDYVDKKSEYSSRNIAPLEIRGDKFFAWDLDKNGLRLFILSNVQDFQVLDETFDKESFG